METVTMAKGKRKSIGPAAKACKGKKGQAFRSCVRSHMRTGKH